jgi:hypothetical protein
VTPIVISPVSLLRVISHQARKARFLILKDASTPLRDIEASFYSEDVATVAVPNRNVLNCADSALVGLSRVTVEGEMIYILISIFFPSLGFS